jgi:RES domain-containing protein
MATFDPARLSRVSLLALAVVGFRNQTPGFDPRSGEGARRFGGRFNPPKSFPVIYLCLTRRCVVAELTRLAERQSVQLEDLLPRELWSVTASLDTVLDLTDESTLSSTDLTTVDLVRPEHAFTQEVGEAAHERGIQAIRSPSATGADDILALFPQNLGASRVDVELVDVWESTGDISA